MDAGQRNWRRVSPLTAFRALKRGESVNYQEHDVGTYANGTRSYNGLAMTHFAKAATLLCRDTWIRKSPLTGERGQSLNRCHLVHVYDMMLPDLSMQQEFQLLLWSIGRKDKPEVGYELARYKNRLYHLGFLGFHQDDQKEQRAKLLKIAAEFLTIDRLRDIYGGLAMGVPIEGERFGKGVVLDRIERQEESGNAIGARVTEFDNV